MYCDMTSTDEHQVRARQLACNIVDVLIEKNEQHTGVIIGALSLVALHIVSMTGDLRELKDAIEDSAT
jgi:hypothetical protein